MLTPDTITNFCLVEYRRDSTFRRLCDEALVRIQQFEPIVQRVEEMFALREANGAYVGKALLDDYHARNKVPQWQLAKQASGGRR